MNPSIKVLDCYTDGEYSFLEYLEDETLKVVAKRGSSEGWYFNGYDWRVRDLRARIRI